MDEFFKAEVAIKTKGYKDKINELNTHCIQNLTASANTCSKKHESNLETVTKTVNHFSKTLTQKKKEIRRLQTQKKMMQATVESCHKQARGNITSLIKEHNTKAKELMNKNIMKDVEIQHYVTASHQLTRHYEDLKARHQNLEFNHTLTSSKQKNINRKKFSLHLPSVQFLGALNDCQHSYYVMAANVSALNSSVEAYKHLVDMHETREKECMNALNICRTGKPVVTSQMNRLLSLKEDCQNQTALCLKDNRALLKNVTSCQQYSLIKHWETLNLTNSNNILALRFEHAFNANSTCHKMVAQKENTLDQLRGEFGVLTKANVVMEQDLHDLKLLLANATETAQELSMKLSRLQEDFAVQESTIDHLLQEEKLRNVYFLREKSRCEVIKEEHQRLLNRYFGGEPRI